MKLPNWLVALSYLGLVPFLAGPLALTLWPHSAPAWLQGAWINYVILVAVFLSGSLWGFGIVMLSQGGSGLGVLIASALALLIWADTLLSLHHSLYGLIVIFSLSLLADLWRERSMGPFPSYFRLRCNLTLGALVAIAWRIALP
ncbi:MAG: DUF3429 family protein [Pseudomonadota bacterium]